jgi:hypothetical protein
MLCALDDNSQSEREGRRRLGVVERRCGVGSWRRRTRRYVIYQQPSTT